MGMRPPGWEPLGRPIGRLYGAATRLANGVYRVVLDPGLFVVEPDDFLHADVHVWTHSHTGVLESGQKCVCVCVCV